MLRARRLGGTGGILLLALAAGAARADEPGAEPTVRLRIGGQPVGTVFRPGVPLPVALELAAPARSAARGRVTVIRLPDGDSPGEVALFDVDVDLPPGGTRLVRGLGLPLSPNARSLEVRWESDGEIAAKGYLPKLAPLDPAQAWVLVLGGDPAVLASLLPKRPADADDEWVPPWVVSAIRADLLPPGATALEGADAVVIAGGFEDSAHPGPDATTVSPGLGAFVGSGGVLLVAGGDSGLAAAGPALSLLPVMPEGTEAGDLRPIAEMFVREGESAPVPLVRAELRDGLALAFAPGGSPLAAMATRGLGTVAWLACGLGDAAVRKAGTGREMLNVLLPLGERGLLCEERLRAWEPAADPPIARLPFDLGGGDWTAGGVTGRDLRIPFDLGRGGRAVRNGRRLWVMRGNKIGVVAPGPIQGAELFVDGRLISILSGDNFNLGYQVSLDGLWDAPLRSLRLPLPRAWNVGNVLGLYCASVVILLLVVGRRLRRPGLAWGFAAAGGLAAFAGLSVRAAAQFSATLAGASFTIAEGAIGGRHASASSSVAIYSPTGAEEILAAAAPADRIGAPPRLLPGAEPPLPCGTVEAAAARVGLAPRAAAGFRIEGTLALGDGVQVEAIRTELGGTGWRVRNAAGRPLRNVEVLEAERRGIVGDLSPGAAAEVWPVEDPERREATGTQGTAGEEAWSRFDRDTKTARETLQAYVESDREDPPPGDVSQAPARFRAAIRREPRRPDSLVVLAETDGPLAEVSLSGRQVFTPGPTLLKLHGRASEAAAADWPRVVARLLDPSDLASEPSEPRRGRSRRVGEPTPELVPVPCVFKLDWPWPVQAAIFRLGMALRFDVLPPRGDALDLEVQLQWDGMALAALGDEALGERGTRLPLGTGGLESAVVDVLDPASGRLTRLAEPGSGERPRLSEILRYLDSNRELRLLLDYSRWMGTEESRLGETAARENAIARLTLLSPRLHIRAARVVPGRRARGAASEPTRPR